MRARGARVAVVVGVMGLGFAGQADAQWTRASDSCDQRWGDRNRERACLTLDQEIGDPGYIEVDGGVNGGVSVEAWNRDVVSVRAKVWASAPSVARAEALADEVRLSVRGGRLSADGPDSGRQESWGVSWEVMVPRDTDLDLETHNGGIDIEGVDGRISFRALNGGVSLIDVAGDVEGRTTNGGLDVELSGTRWDGAGLDVQTTNGGVTVRVPTNYSAQLETGTVNGGIELDFPVTVQGRLGRRLDVTLGEGGPTVRAVTTNGGVKLERSRNSIR